MKSAIFSHKHFDIYIKDDDESSLEYLQDSYIFLPIPYLINLIEKKKKTEYILPSSIKNVVSNLKEKDDVFPLSMTKECLEKALLDEDFQDNYISKKMNPIKLSAYISIKHNYECWGDVDELIENINSINW